MSENIEYPIRVIVPVVLLSRMEAFEKYVDNYTREIISKKYSPDILQHLDFYFLRIEENGKTVIYIDPSTIYGAFKVALGIAGKEISLTNYVGSKFIIEGMYLEDKTYPRVGQITKIPKQKKKQYLQTIQTNQPLPPYVIKPEEIKKKVEKHRKQEESKEEEKKEEKKEEIEIKEVKVEIKESEKHEHYERSLRNIEILKKGTRGNLVFIVFDNFEKFKEILSKIKIIIVPGSPKRGGVVLIKWNEMKTENI